MQFYVGNSFVYATFLETHSLMIEDLLGSYWLEKLLRRGQCLSKRKLLLVYNLRLSVPWQNNCSSFKRRTFFSRAELRQEIKFKWWLAKQLTHERKTVKSSYVTTIEYPYSWTYKVSQCLRIQWYSLKWSTCSLISKYKDQSANRTF